MVLHWRRCGRVGRRRDFLLAPGGFRPAGGLACCGRLPPKLGSGVTVQRHLTRACAMAFEAHGAQQPPSRPNTSRTFRRLQEPASVGTSVMSATRNRSVGVGLELPLDEVRGRVSRGGARRVVFGRWCRLGARETGLRHRSGDPLARLVLARAADREPPGRPVQDRTDDQTLTPVSSPRRKSLSHRERSGARPAKARRGSMSGHVRPRSERCRTEMPGRSRCSATSPRAGARGFGGGLSSPTPAPRRAGVAGRSCCRRLRRALPCNGVAILPRPV